MLKFRIVKKDKHTLARAGTLTTPHGTIQTPYYMPVATKAVVKALTSEDMEELGAELLMCNTYHLFLQPSEKTIKKAGGLHSFMHWQKPIMTDSAGFQAFSLGYGLEHGTGKFGGFFPEENNNQKKTMPKKAFVDDTGVTFHIDGKKIKLTPEKSMQIQHDLGADLIIAFDECTSPLADYEYVKKSLARTHSWAARCIKEKERLDKNTKTKDTSKNKQSLFGVIQGSYYKDLRKEATRFITSLPFEGYCIGGSLGKTKKDMHAILGWVTEALPENKPRHLLGVGTVEDFFEAVERGIDLFDCVGPTRIARVGLVYTSRKAGGNKANKFRIKITKRKFSKDFRAIDTYCKCKVCRHYSRAYIHHLFKAKELSAYYMTSYHNVYFMLNLMKEIRNSILKGNFKKLKKAWLG